MDIIVNYQFIIGQFEPNIISITKIITFSNKITRINLFSLKNPGDINQVKVAKLGNNYNNKGSKEREGRDRKEEITTIKEGTTEIKTGTIMMR